MTDQREPWERLLDLAVYAPIGLVVCLQEDLPRYVRQGRQAVENRIMVARWIGQMAVQQGKREIGKHLAASRPAVEVAGVDEVAVAVPELPSPPESIAAPAGAVDGAVVSEPDAADGGGAPIPHPAEVAAPAGRVAAPDASDLPIEGYESLAALHVVQRLAGLNPAELDAVRRFEETHRARRTILAKVAQLQSDRA